MSGGGRLRTLAVTSLFPNSLLPHSSAFNRQQLTALASLCDLEVWAPIPWFPLASLLVPHSSAGRASGVPKRTRVGGLDVRHPRTFQVPIVGRPIAGPLFAASIAARLFRRRGELDVVLATWAYPDGWAATVLGAVMGLPTVVKVHGSDINVVAQKPAQRAQLRAVLPRAAGVIAVSRQLAERVIELGVPPERVHWIPNGVDRERFRPRDSGDARTRVALDDAGDVVVYIGNLKREKGVFDLLEAWPQVSAARPAARLVIVGSGPDGDAVNAACESLDGAMAVGAVAHSEVATWMAACDVLCLPSWFEGMPNVVVEAHASGRPVVATRVGGSPDLITDEALGRLVPPRDPAALATGLIETLEARPAAESVCAAASAISWEESARLVYEVLGEASG